MSDLTKTSGKRDKDQAKLITPPSATIPPKLSKIEIPTDSSNEFGITTPLLELNSPVTDFRRNFMNIIESWKRKSNLLTPSALNPLQEQNALLRSNQQVLADSLSEVKADITTTKNEMNITQEEFRKIHTKENEIEAKIDATKSKVILTQEEFIKLQQRESEMKATIEDLKTRCNWLSDSLREQRSSLENQILSLMGKVQDLTSINSNELKNTITNLNLKVSSLETTVNQFRNITEQQQQTIAESENKINRYVELINHQQQAIEFLLHKNEVFEKNNNTNALVQAISELSKKINIKNNDFTFDETMDVTTGTSYPVFHNIPPYSGNRVDAPQFVETVRKLFETSNYDNEQKNFFLSTHMGPEYNWYNFNKVDNEGNARNPEMVLDLFEETFVTKLSIQEYTNRWMNLKFVWGKEYDYLANFKYYLSFNIGTPFSIVQSVMVSQVPKEIGDELQKLDENSNIQDLYDCILRIKREREDKKRLDKSRGLDSRKWSNHAQKPNDESSKKEPTKN